MELPLAGGDHDWNYLLDRLNLLNHAEFLGRLVFVLGMITIVFSLGLLINDLARRRKHPQEDN